jgi:hypothetical protein
VQMLSAYGFQVKLGADLYGLGEVSLRAVCKSERPKRRLTTVGEPGKRSACRRVS